MNTLKKKKKRQLEEKYISEYIYICLELYVFYINSMLFVIFPIRI